MSDATTLALLDRDLAAVPAELAQRVGAVVKTLNLTENRIRGAVSNLHLFTAVETLVLDSNGLDSLDGFPKMPTVTTLWLNKNAVRPVFFHRGGGALAGCAARPHPTAHAALRAPRSRAPLSHPSSSPTCPSLPTRWRRPFRA